MCAKSNSNRKLLTISLVFLSCGSNAAHGWHILYQRWRNPPQDSGVDRIYSFLFFYLRFCGVISWFQKYRFDLDGQIGTLGFKRPSTIAEYVSRSVERQKTTITDSHECDLPSRGRPRAAEPSIISRLPGWMNYTSIAAPSQSLTDSRSLLNTSHVRSVQFQAVFIISAQQEGIKALTSVHLNSVYRSLPHWKQFYHEETWECVAGHET